MATQKNYVIAVVNEGERVGYICNYNASLPISFARTIYLQHAIKYYKKDTGAVVKGAKKYWQHVAVFHIDTAEADATTWAKSIASVAQDPDCQKHATIVTIADELLHPEKASAPAAEYVVAMKTFDPRDGTHDIRFLTHVDYHCQTDTQLAEAKRLPTLEQASKKATRFNRFYAEGTNEAAREHSILYGMATVWAVGDIGSDSWGAWSIAPYSIRRGGDKEIMCIIDPLEDYTGKPHPLGPVPPKHNSGTTEALRQLEEGSGIYQEVSDVVGAIVYGLVVLLVLAAMALALWGMEKYEVTQMTKYCQSAWGDVSEQVGYNPNAGTNGQCTMLIHGKMVPVTTALALYPSVRVYASQTVEGERGVTVPAKAKVTPAGVGTKETKL